LDCPAGELRPRVVCLGALALAVALTFVAGAAARTALGVELVVTKTGPGTVRSLDGAIACGRRCNVRFSRGRLVGLLAETGPFVAFVGWSGACFGRSTGCVLAMDEGRRVQATFRSLPSLVRLTVGGGGTVTSEPRGLMCGSTGRVCAAPFAVGSEVALWPHADPSHEFVDWTGSCSEPVASPCMLRVPDTVPRPSVTATFRRTGGPIADARLSVNAIFPTKDELDHMVGSSPPGIDCPPVCTASFTPGSIVTLGGQVTEWSGACVGSAPRCRVAVDEPLQVSARVPFLGGAGPPPRLGVNVTVSGRGTITDGQLIRCGEQARSIRDCQAFFGVGQLVALRAVPARGARFVGWGGFCGGRGRCTLRALTTMNVSGLFRG
jgi:Divergent InlB B-repeat domain